MEQMELKHFRGVLEDMLVGLGPLRKREGIVVEDSADTLDQVGYAAERDLPARQLELHSSRFRELKAAIRRCAEGTYGICLACGSVIGIKRLNAVPWTCYCIACQELADHNGTTTDLDRAPATELSHRLRPMHAH